MPSLATMESIRGGVANVEGVTRSKVYENDSNTTDGDGIPAHSISAVVEGGTSQDIADVIALRKTPGTGTYGTTAVTTYDSYGIPNVINFYRPTIATIKVSINITALTGYLSSYAYEIKTAVAAYINSLDIGDDVYITKIYKPAITSNSATYDITSIKIARDSDPLRTSNIIIGFSEVAMTSISNITVGVS